MTGVDSDVVFKFEIDSSPHRPMGWLSFQKKGIIIGNTIEYYAILTEIVELQYLDGRRVTLFRCN